MPNMHATYEELMAAQVKEHPTSEPLLLAQVLRDAHAGYNWHAVRAIYMLLLDCPTPFFYRVAIRGEYEYGARFGTDPEDYISLFI